MGKERSSSRSHKSVSSTFKNTMERKDKKKAVPGVSNQFQVLSEMNRKYGKRTKQLPESQISFKHFQKYNGKKRKEKSSSQSLKSVSSTFRKTMERQEKRKAVPGISNQF